MIIFNICSEANPYVKTGGLADVTYALSKELSDKNNVNIILPLYNQIKTKGISYNKVCEIDVYMSWRHETSSVYLEKRDGINYYFIENRHYFERDSIYGYDDDGERFAFFDLAAIETLVELNIVPDIIHVHDWQVGMIPLLIKNNHKEFFTNTKTVLTIHNGAFLGYLDPYSLGDLYNLDSIYYDNGGVRLNDRVSTLKAGIMYANKITAVSPTNRNELLTAEGGNGLDSALALREWDFTGFLNGIDYVEFDPETDKYLTFNFNKENAIEGKKKNKISLCKELNLKNPNAPLFGLVSRITWQKGMDLVFEAVHHIVARGGNVVLLGSGEADKENTMKWLQQTYPDNVAIYIGYNNALAHKIYASADFFLMPSLFEPCGLGQMIAQRYGTLPIVRRTGGLYDSVINFDGHNENSSNGFGFIEFSANEMINTCIYALDTMKNTDLHHKLVINAMETDNSWKRSGNLYLGMYKELLNK